MDDNFHQKVNIFSKMQYYEDYWFLRLFSYLLFLLYIELFTCEQIVNVIIIFFFKKENMGIKRTPYCFVLKYLIIFAFKWCFPFMV